MNKNKKILLTITVIFIISLISVNRIEAKTIMLLNCQYIEQCTSEACNINSFIRNTDNEGNIDWNGIYAAGQHNYAFNLIEYYKKGATVVGIGYMDLENEDYCWINDYSHIDDDCKEDRSIGWKGKNTYYDFFNEGICPTGVRYQKWDKAEIVPAGKDGILTNDTLYLDEPKYIVYKYKDTKGNIRMVAEGYNSDGKYCVVGPDLTKTIKDEVAYHQLEILRNSINEDKKVSFFDVDTNFNNLII